MPENLQDSPEMLDGLAFLVRVSQHDGRAIEDALGAPTLFDRGVDLRGAIVEATYAATEPPLLQRLRDDSVPYAIDPQTSRFGGWRFVQVQQFARVPYAPKRPIVAGDFPSNAADELARAVLRFEQDAGASWYVAAGLPYVDDGLNDCVRQNDRLLDASCAANGTGDLERRPLVAQVIVGRRGLAQPQLIVNRLLDYPIDAVYVQAQRLDPVRDGIEKLARYVEFLLALKDAGLTVIAGRVGAFGLLLQALGITAFDSGLCQAEAFDLASLNRPLTEAEMERRRERRGGGGDRRIYLEQLKTTLKGRHATAILEDASLRSRFTCSLGCCQHRGFDDLPDRRRQHYLWVRHREVDELRHRPSDNMRVDWIHEQLRDARGAGQAVRRALTTRDLRDIPRFDHLDRWIGVLARQAQVRAAA
jgi:hypothetical protein